MRKIKDCYNKPAKKEIKELIPYSTVNDEEFFWITVNKNILIYRKYLDNMEYYHKGRFTRFAQITRIKP